ncbi:MAG: hypothetical protein Fur0037_03890 [Planctomycetota bacterium]
MLAVWALACAFLLVRAFAAGMLRKVPAEGPWTARRVDVNRAGIPELCTLPGIGPARARAIVLHRVRHGWFRGLPDLLAVDGIGPDTLRKLAPHAFAGAAAPTLSQR